MELMLDSANLKEIRTSLKMYPICGVTTNPSILKKEGSVDFFKHLKTIEEMITPSRSLHVQIVAETSEEIIKEASKIRSILGDDVYIKIPVTPQGIEATKVLVEKGFNITATAIYSTFQGLMALMAGAKYLAIYYNRMDNIDVNPNRVIADLARLIKNSSYDCKIVAASFRNINQITSAYIAGAQSCTISYSLMSSGTDLVSVKSAVETFHSDWLSIHGEKTICDLK